MTFQEFITLRTSDLCNLLIFDEVTSGLDIESESLFLNILRSDNMKNKSIIIITHSSSLQPDSFDRDIEVYLDNGVFSKIR